MRTYHQLALFAVTLLTLLTPTAGRTSEVCQRNRAPLRCSAASLMIKGGVAPALFTNRGPNWVVDPFSVDPGLVSTVNNVFTFNEIARVPWTVGAEFAFNTSRRGQLFLEYAYSQANGKSIVIPGGAELILSDYATHAGYLGMRFYLAPWRFFSCCGLFAPYAGFKTGLVAQEEVRFQNASPVFTAPFWRSRTVVSSGLQIGGEWWFAEHLSLVLQAEFIATQGPRTNANIITPVSSPSNISVGRIGWVVTFPVTLGLRWTF